MNNEELEKHLQEQKKKSKKEAEKFDKKRFGRDASTGQSETQKARIAGIKLSQDKVVEERLKDFDLLVKDPLVYLRERVKDGDFQVGKEDRFQLYLLISLMKIQTSLAEVKNFIEKRK